MARKNDFEPIEVYGSALKHGFSEREVRVAWKSALATRTVVRIRFDKQPPHYMGVGLVGNSKVEVIAASDGFTWHVFHADSPLTGGFKKEYRENGGIL